MKVCLTTDRTKTARMTVVIFLFSGMHRKRAPPLKVCMGKILL